MHSELSIDRHTCTPHRQAHTHVIIGAADCRKGRSRLARLARGQADDWSSWQQQEHTVQAALSFSPPGRLSCAAARAMSSRAEYSTFLDAYHLGGDHGHQDSCAGRPGATQHGVLRATRRMDGRRNISQLITKTSHRRPPRRGPSRRRTKRGYMRFLNNSLWPSLSCLPLGTGRVCTLHRRAGITDNQTHRSTHARTG